MEKIVKLFLIFLFISSSVSAATLQNYFNRYHLIAEKQNNSIIIKPKEEIVDVFYHISYSLNILESYFWFNKNYFKEIVFVFKDKEYFILRVDVLDYFKASSQQKKVFLMREILQSR